MTKLLWTCALTALLASCGDDSNQCGPDTREENGVCVAAIDCGQGTVANEEGTACVPDGSVVCADGTMFDVASGTCVPSDTVCGDGTVLVDGVCRDPATVTPDAEESAEVNDNTGAGQITVPAIGEDGFVIHGCITSRDNGETADVDPWLLDVTGPTLLEISADGVGGLAAGFAVLYAENDAAMADYARFGLNLVTDSAKRQVYLPAAGLYILGMTDQRTLVGLGAAGTDTTCYYTTIKQLAMPAPIALTPGTDVTGTDNGEVKVYRFTSTADGTIFKATMTESSSVMDPAWVATRANAFHGLATDQGGAAPGPTRYVGAVDNGDAVDVIVDMEFNSSQAPVPFTISSYSIGASALPTNGDTVTVTKQNGQLPSDPIAGQPLRTINYYYFDVDASTPVVYFDVTETEASFFLVFRTDIVNNDLGEIDTLVELAQPQTGVQSFSGEFVHFLTPGRYYVGLFQNGGTAGDTYSMTSTVIGQDVGTVAVGTPLNDEAIHDTTGSAFKSFTPGTAKWVEMTGGGTNLGANEDLEVLYYPLDQEGWLDGVVVSDPLFDQGFAADGTDPAIGRITLNFESAPFLVRFRSTGGVAAGQTFDYGIANRTFTELTVTEAAPIAMMDVTVPANGSKRFLVNTTGRVTFATQGADFDAVIDRLDYDEFPLVTADATDGTGDETLSNQKYKRGYVAFEIYDKAGAAGTFDLNVTSLDAAPYTEICPSLGGQGTQILATVDDGLSATQTLPVAFDLFGDSVTMFKASSNGFISFDPALPAGSYYAYTALPNASDPNGIIAPYWDDLATQVCVSNTATRTIVEWNGLQLTDGWNVEFQLSIYQNGRLEIAYGPGHEEDGFFGVAGAENIAGDTGLQLWYRQSGEMAPGAGDVITLP